MSTNNKIPTQTTKPSLIPMGVTVGLAIFAFLLAIAGYGFRLLSGDSTSSVLRHALVVVSFFLVVVPSAFVGGSMLLNRLQDTYIHPRNAWTLGLLTSVVAILSIMGRYS